MIEYIGELANNPVRAHIRMGFHQVKSEAEQLAVVLNDLRTQGFDATHSRVLIFVRSKQRAEEAAEQLAEMAQTEGQPWAGQIDYFHAGLDGYERSEKYQAYKASPATKEDSIAVLIATKAFGMGMDISNIHYVYHLGASSTFEDFLQEIGRAGRNKASREAAGFSEDKPIRTLCVMTTGEFRELRGLQHKSALTWGHIHDAQAQVHQYLKKFRELKPDSAHPFTLPLDLGQKPNDPAAGVRFRLALHWLEQLKRIQLRLYTPAFLPIKLLQTAEEVRGRQEKLREIDKQRSAIIDRSPLLKLEAKESKVSDAERGQLCQLVASLEALPGYEAGAAVTVPMEDLKKAAGVKRHSELYRMLFRAQKTKVLTIDRHLHLELGSWRREELTAWRPKSWTSEKTLPLVEALFSLAEQLLKPVASFGQRKIASPELNALVEETGREHFTSRSIYWQEQLPRSKRLLVKEELVALRARDWQERRAKFALKVLRLLPNVRVQSELHTTGSHRGTVAQIIFNGNRQTEDWQKPLTRLKEKLLELLRHVLAKANTHNFNYAGLVVELKLEEDGLDYLNQLLFLARSLGYLKTSGSFVPMGIELFLNSTTVPDLQAPTSEDNELQQQFGHDTAVHKQFLEATELRELRLLALECLADLAAETQDTFIKQYFACNGSADLVGLLGNHLGPENDKLKAFRQVALKEAEAKLNEEQRKVYDAPLTANLQVIAGPGTGKTHTLTLRVARLIQEFKKQPNEILILAYNRAVVVELKERLGSLFQKLGYGKLINRLHVYTFHGLCKRCLGASLDEAKFDEWVPALARALADNPNLIQQQLGPIAYVFVDEFQDITPARLAILKKIAPKDLVKICVIGDPNQSIYGYERGDEGGEMDPFFYYEQFKAHYEPDTLFLSTNYRSYPAILAAADQLLVDNPQNFEIPKLTAFRKPSHQNPYYEPLAYSVSKTQWPEKLLELLVEEHEPGKPYQQVAVMLRSNDEVFRAFNRLRDVQLPAGVSVRIQGATTSPVASREFFHLLHHFRKDPQAALSQNDLQDFEELKQRVLRKFGSVWDTYLIQLVHCLLLEFRVEREDEAINQDLLDFVADMGRKDDGHFAKLYAKYHETVEPGKVRREVVLTTMHKVKGLEFDAVLLPASLVDFGLDLRTGQVVENIVEVSEEERRLLYVAYTRARYRLVVINYDREAAVMAGKSYTLENWEKKMGRVVQPGYGRVDISWWAKQANTYIHDIIRDRVKVGDSILLIKQGTGKWHIKWQNKTIGQLASNSTWLAADSQAEGLAISNIMCYTLAESLAFDGAQKKPTNYTDHWTELAKTRGYVYIIDFAGYYKAT